ncbi:MAG: hypothetical protein PHS68_01480, partial [Candidatus Izemoplasmatales bacterium]|nr:hypothetical protein [Candidatus Izemoplasmatales bacterium]
WFSELKPIAHTEDGTPVNKKEMDAMRKRIRELEMENEILKKANHLPIMSHALLEFFNIGLVDFYSVLKKWNHMSNEFYYCVIATSKAF